MAHEKKDRPEVRTVSRPSSSKPRAKAPELEEVTIGDWVFSVYGGTIVLKIGKEDAMQWGFLTPKNASELVALLEKYLEIAKV